MDRTSIRPFTIDDSRAMLIYGLNGFSSLSRLWERAFYMESSCLLPHWLQG